MILPTKEPSFGVLDNVKVIYSAVEIAAPTAAVIMAEWGADVTWIENVWTGNSMRDTAWVKEMERRNIHSISMNPFTENGKEILRVTVKDADVFIKSGKGPMYARKGITDEFLWGISPKLVAAHASDFGRRSDGEQINSAVYNLTVATYVGIVAQNGSVDQPMNISPYLGDYISSLMIISSALVTLCRVGVTDEDESIDMAMYEALLRVGTCYMMDYMNADILYPRPDARHQNLCGIGIYEYEDGFIGLCLYGVSQDKYLLETIELGHPRETEEYPKGTSALWLNGPKTGPIRETLEEYLRTQSKFDMQRDFVARRIAAQVVNEFPNILAADHVKARECFIDSKKVGGTPAKVLSTFPKFRRNPGVFQCPVPALGESTRDALKHAGYSDEGIGCLVESGTVKVRNED